VRLEQTFREWTGRHPEGRWSAPGRVNLIGEHTDYNDGRVLPFALPLRSTVAAARRADRWLRIRSCQQAGPPVEVALDGLAAGAVTGWAAYVAGVVWSVRAAGCPAGGMDLLVDGAVPAGSGLSSSAAIECATALAVTDLYGPAGDAAALARICRRAENEFVGVPCGLMDQMASIAATAGHALLFDTRSGQLEPLAFDPPAAGLSLLVVDTRTKHVHAAGAYADRRRACADAAARLGVAALRDIPEDNLSQALARLEPEPVLARRVRHVVTEDARVVRTAALLRAGRLAEIGPLLDESHRSLRDDFEVSCAELDVTADAARAGGALGARLTGGGFGGCVIALVPHESAAAVQNAIREAARRRGWPEPGFVPATPSAGARRDPC
jgi:galactokinase